MHVSEGCSACFVCVSVCLSVSYKCIKRLYSILNTASGKLFVYFCMLKYLAIDDPFP